MKRENSIHVRITDDADALLELMRLAGGRDKSALASELLEEALLGRGHGIKVAAMRFARAGLMGTERDTKG